MGCLEQVFRLAHQRLTPQGLFAFSVEKSANPAGYTLQAAQTKVVTCVRVRVLWASKLLVAACHQIMKIWTSFFLSSEYFDRSLTFNIDM